MAKYDISENTKEVYLKGKIKWSQGLFRLDDMYSKWTVKFYPDAESLEIIRELQALGLKNKVEKDEDGYVTTLSRPGQKMMKGIVKAFTPPVVEDKDGNALTGGIGNGSDAICKMEVYKYKSPGGNKWQVAYRLAAVRVMNLIPFEREKDFTDADKRQAEGITDQEFVF